MNRKLTHIACQLLKSLSFPLLLILFAASQSGCATTETAPAKDVRLIEIGMPRAKVIAEFGEPLEDIYKPDQPREWNEGRFILLSYGIAIDKGLLPAFKQADAYVFIDGYERPVRMTGADAFYKLASTGSWEPKPQPFTPSAYGSHICIVTYDSADKVNSVRIFKKRRLR